MPNIKIYSTPTCPYCQMAKQFLDNKGIAYTSIDVTTDQQAATEMVNKSGQMGVPVLDIDGHILTGFDRDRISEILNI
ncbi:glutaredoxin family protein [Candidatus Margulisiibacteriota bacterium]